MAGVYGEINSRTDFFNALNGATAAVSGMLKTTPDEETLAAILRQLQAIARWTANGREPTSDERESIDIAVRASREYEGDARMYGLTRRLYAIDSYFSDWPTDEQAANATDDDYFDADDDD